MHAQPWKKTYKELGIPEEINPDAYSSVAELLEGAMTRYADKTAFHCGAAALTYAEVDRISGAVAAWLQNTLGVKRGDRVAVMLPNLLAFPLAFLGIMRAGAVQVNVNPMYTPRELEHQLNDAGAETIIIFSGSTPTLAEIIGNTCVKTVIVAQPTDGTPASPAGPAVDPRLSKTTAFAQVIHDGAGMSRQPVSLNGDDLLFLQYTGGTTGLSKGASLSHRNLVANCEQFKQIVPDNIRPGEEVIVTALPLYHIFALMVNFIGYFSVGAENWLVPNPRDMDGFIDTMKKARPTVFMGVNTLYAGLANHPRIGEVDFSRLRLAGGGGAAVVSATSEKWQKVTGTFIKEGYGLSETSPVLSFNPAAVKEFSGTTGIPLPSTDIKLLDDAGEEVALGEAGEVCAKGPQVMRGYWNQPAANASAFTADGYFRTGDVGVFTEKGFLKIVDRKKDMIIVSGFNVFPNEIEEVVMACPGVAECACVGVPDEKSGEAVKLVVARLPGATLTAEEITAHCRKEMTAYKVPRIIVFIDSLPKSAVGKILRRELRGVAQS